MSNGGRVNLQAAGEGPSRFARAQFGPVRVINGDRQPDRLACDRRPHERAACLVDGRHGFQQMHIDEWRMDAREVGVAFGGLLAGGALSG